MSWPKPPLDKTSAAGDFPMLCSRWEEALWMQGKQGQTGALQSGTGSDEVAECESSGSVDRIVKDLLSLQWDAALRTSWQ